MRRRPARCAAARVTTNWNRSVTYGGDEPPIIQKTLRRTPSTFRWRSSPEIVENSLKGMSFTISGTLNCLNAEDVVEMIEFCGGTVYKTLAKKSNHLITGNNASKTWIRNAIESEKTVLNEKQFMDLVRDKGKVQNLLSYRQQKDNTDEEEGEDNWSDICLISSDDTEEG